MVHTLPDGTTKYKLATIFGQIDTGELAARLGSINTFDRRGNVAWMDDFQGSLLKWQYFTTGEGGSISLNSTYVRNGDQSCKMVPGSGFDASAYMYRHLALPVVSNMGFECSFTTHADLKEIQFLVGFYDGSDFKESGILASIADDKLYYRNPSWTWTEFQDGWLPLVSPNLFNTLKFVFDYSTTDYIRAILNNTRYDLSAYDYYSMTDNTKPFVVPSVIVINAKAGNPAIHVDDVIFTQNEP